MFQINDEMYAALGGLGFTGTLPNRIYNHLGSLGHTGAMNDRLSKVGGYQAYVFSLFSAPTEAPVITLQPLDVTVDEGIPWSITSAATGAASSEWYKDAVATGISGNTFSGTGLSAEGGSYFNRYTNVIGSVDTSASTVGVGSDSRTLIDLNKGSNSNYGITSWSVTGDYRIKLKFAVTNSGGIYLFILGGVMLYLSAGGDSFYVYPNITTSTDYYRFATGMDIQDFDFHELELVGNTSTRLMELALNGVNLTNIETTLTAHNFTGAAYVGRGNTVVNDAEAIIADFELTDVGDSDNSPLYALDQATGNTESSLTNSDVATYNSIAEGLPTRELFTLNGAGTEWVGNNGTTLTVKY